MSSTQVTESSKSLLLCLRIIKVKLFAGPENKAKCKLVLKLGNQAWAITPKKTKASSLKFFQSHSFEINDDSVLDFSLVEERLLFKSAEIGNGAMKIKQECRKSIDWVMLRLGNFNCGKVLISFLVDEKIEAGYNFKDIYLLELEKEEVKYFKRKYVKKLQQIKKEKSWFRKNASNLLEFMYGKLNQSCLEFKRMQADHKLRVLSVGNGRKTADFTKLQH